MGCQSSKPAEEPAKPKESTSATPAQPKESTDLVPLVVADDMDKVEETLKSFDDGKKAAVVDGKDAAGTPLLHLACSTPSVDMLGILLAAKPDLNAVDSAGLTALMVAATKGDEDCVMALVEAGADLKKTNKDGKTAEDLATDDGLKEVLSGEGMGEMKEMEAKAKGAGKQRVSVSAESVDPDALKNQQLPSYPKGEADIARIEGVISGNFLFKAVDSVDRSRMIMAMFEEKKGPGQDIITQGEKRAEVFYVIDSGECEVYKSFDGAEPKMLKTLKAGDSFGELALMYNTPRAATIKAKTATTLWCMDRETFRAIVLMATMKKRTQYEECLKSVELFSTIDQYERASLADAMVEQTFKAGDAVVTEGEAGNTLYIVIKGEAEALTAKDGQVGTYKANDFFGELAMLNQEPRKATVKATSDLTVAAMDRDGFDRLLGGLVPILERNIQQFTKYGDLIKKAKES